MERARGTPAQNRAYCTKDRPHNGERLEFGDCPKSGQGRRTDLLDLEEAIKKGASHLELIDEHMGTFIKYHHGIEKVMFHLNQRKAQEYRNVTVKVYYGPTGVGKTRRALEEARAEDGEFYVLQCGHKGNLWWDGYTGQKTLVMDEYQGNWAPYKGLLGILDGNPLRLAIKGGHGWANWTTVIVTSSKRPTEWYDRLEYSELNRRIDSIIHMDNVNNLGGMLGRWATGRSGGNTNGFAAPLRNAAAAASAGGSSADAYAAHLHQR